MVSSIVYTHLPFGYYTRHCTQAEGRGIWLSWALYCNKQPISRRAGTNPLAIRIKVREGRGSASPHSLGDGSVGLITAPLVNPHCRRSCLYLGTSHPPTPPHCDHSLAGSGGGH